MEGEHKVRPYSYSTFSTRATVHPHHHVLNTRKLEKVLPRQNRLTSAQFDRAFNQSQVVRHRLVQARAHQRGDESGAVRAAFVVPKKQGKAHDRNRTKRRLRERFRLHARRDEPNLRGCDLILMTTPATGAATLPELDAALDEVLRRLAKRMNGSNRSEQPKGPDRGLAPSDQQETGDESKALEAELPPFSNGGNDQALEEGASPASLDSQREPREITFKSAPVSWVFIALIRFYQRAISPSLPPSCRFFPTCSAYTLGAIERYGPLKGTLLGAWRICRCTPLHPGGFDPVPEIWTVRPSHFLGLKLKRDA